MKQNVTEILTKVQLADAAAEVGAAVVIKFGVAEIKMPLDALKGLKEKNMPTDVFSCIVTGCVVFGGKKPKRLLPSSRRA